MSLKFTPGSTPGIWDYINLKFVERSETDLEGAKATDSNGKFVAQKKSCNDLDYTIQFFFLTFRKSGDPEIFFRFQILQNICKNKDDKMTFVYSLCFFSH